MESQKLDDALALALDVQSQGTDRQIVDTSSLFDGYSEEENMWELIIKYNGDLSRYLSPEIKFEPLIAGYGIVTIPQRLIEGFVKLEQIEYVEKPQKIIPQVENGLADACFAPILATAGDRGGLDGQGVWSAVIDSGIDYTRDVFRTPDGKSKIAWIYDQRTNTLFTHDQIEESLTAYDKAGVAGGLFEPLLTDLTGHGTNVSEIVMRAAPGSRLAVVRLAPNLRNGFVLTTNLMRAVSLVVNKAQDEQMPVAINVSYGNSYGSHDGTSILERFMDNAAEIGRNVICVAAGNEGAVAGHYTGQLEVRAGSQMTVPFSIGRYEQSLSLQIWSYPSDRFLVTIVSPAGQRYQINASVTQGLGQSTVLEHSRLDIFCGTAKPYRTKEEIYISFSPVNRYIDSGNWELQIISVQIKNGSIQMYLPAQETRSIDTRFLFPDPYATITIPATAGKVISVGAYAADFSAYAPFSGRGNYGRLREGEENLWEIPKPDLVAPGVGIRLGEGTEQMILSGTSYATPFVTGAAAILMQWGIVLGNDPYMYGEKIKAVLQSGALLLQMDDVVPNALTGWGKLCLYQSLNKLR